MEIIGTHYAHMLHDHSLASTISFNVIFLFLNLVVLFSPLRRIAFCGQFCVHARQLMQLLPNSGFSPCTRTLSTGHTLAQIAHFVQVSSIEKELAMP